MKCAKFTPIVLWLICFSSFGQVFEVDTIQYTGDIDHRVNLVILGDGYQNHELSQFEIDARNFSETFFSNRPYTEYQQFFNVFAIKVPSNESGASHPGTATDVTEPAIPVIEVDNYFGSTFDYLEVHRLLVPVNTVAIRTVLANNFPTYNQVVILVNTPYYGGSGGEFATATTNPASSDVAIHEIGHSFVGLGDEYWPGEIFVWETLNMTQENSTELVRWKNWVGDNKVGIFPHCCGETSSSWYKPHENCKMQFLNVPFCPVCVEGTIERIHSLTMPIISYSPLEASIFTKSAFDRFEVELIEPVPNTLKKQWFLNEVELDNHTDSLSFSELALESGKNTLTFVVEDTTELIRVDGHEIHVASLTWIIDNAAIHIESDHTICQGDSVFLQGAYQNTDGIFTDTVVVTGGPDTIYTTTLSIQMIDLSVSQSRDSLFANARGAFYQWFDCKDYMPVEGATGQLFTPVENGEYALEISLNACRDTTECYSVTTIGFWENRLKDSFKVYPNPTDGKLNISLEGEKQISGHMIRILGSDGRTVYFRDMGAEEIQIDMSDFGPEGLYYLQLIGPEGGIKAVRKVVRK